MFRGVTRCSSDAPYNQAIISHVVKILSYKLTCAYCRIPTIFNIVPYVCKMKLSKESMCGHATYFNKRNTNIINITFSFIYKITVV